MSVFTKEGFKSLRWVYGVTLAGIGVAAFLVIGSYLYWQSEKKNDLGSAQTLRDLRSRLEAAKRERDNLRDSEQTYSALTSRGVFLPEDRLELIEAMAKLKQRHRLIGLDYEVSPQRIVKLNAGLALPAIDVIGSRIRMKVSAYHDGDLVAFLDDFPRMQRGFFPLDRCVIRRASDAEKAPAANQPAAPGVLGTIVAAIGTLRTGTPPSAPTAAPEAPKVAKDKSGISALIEADCTLEWITLLDKRNANIAAAAAANAAATGTKP